MSWQRSIFIDMFREKWTKLPDDRNKNKAGTGSSRICRRQYEKIAAAVLAAMMVFSLAACAGAEEETVGNRFRRCT